MLAARLLDGKPRMKILSVRPVLVDDSLSVRELERKLLSSLGYAVDQVP
jgi:hypothetical protein